MPQFDIVVVGGGLAGSSLATAMARNGARVLVLEKETRFRDRIRGEYLCPWGTAEVREVGLLDAFHRAGGLDMPWIDMGMGPRDIVATAKWHLPAMTYSHPEIQEGLLEAARQAGAEVRGGVTVQRIEPGKVPTVDCNGSGPPEKITARLVVAADGRNSAARRWAGFATQRDERPYLMAGVLLDGVSFRRDLSAFIFNSDTGTVTGTIPQASGCVRAYFGYPVSAGYRLQGKEALSLLLAECVKSSPFLADAYANARDAGPLASFDTNDSWVDHPYKDGVALIGDAAATSDPSFGQGMSLTFRDVRVLRDSLLANSDWDRAGHAYADQHDSYYHRCHEAVHWLRTVFQEQTPEAALIRQKALPLIAQDPTRVPDHLMGGPELPLDDSVRARFFGEA